MAFYGMLLAASIILSLAAVHSAWQYTSAMNRIYMQRAAFDRLLYLSAFSRIAGDSGAEMASPGQYQSWKAALSLCAIEDGMRLRFTNSSLTIISEGKGIAVKTIDIKESGGGSPSKG